MAEEFKGQVSAIREVRVRAARQVRSLPNVIGTGIGFKITKGERTKEVGLSVFVRRKVSPDFLKRAEAVPEEVEGVKTDVVAVNPVAFLAQPGSSIGHYDIGAGTGAGTFGLVTSEKDTGQLCILSNNHVLANVNSGIIGDPILQPGTLDGGVLLDDTLAHLYKTIPLKLVSIQGTPTGVNLTIPEGTNIADAALALPFDPNDIDPVILGIGLPPQGLVRPTIGMDVQKSGRTTNVTTGTIFATDAEIEVGYDGAYGIFSNQVAIFGSGSGGSGFSLPGDSGSSILDLAGNASALLFAGDDAAGVTFANPLAIVLNMLNQELAP